MENKNKLRCPKCKKVVKHFLAYTKNYVKVFSYDGKQFKIVEDKNSFLDLIFVCPLCDEIISHNKEGIDFYIQKKFINRGCK